MKNYIVATAVARNRLIPCREMRFRGQDPGASSKFDSGHGVVERDDPSRAVNPACGGLRYAPEALACVRETSIPPRDRPAAAGNGSWGQRRDPGEIRQTCVDRSAGAIASRARAGVGVLPSRIPRTAWARYRLEGRTAAAVSAGGSGAPLRRGPQRQVLRKAALARGVAFGRPAKLRDDQKEAVHELVRAGRSISSIARTFDVHPATIYRCIKESRSL